MTMWTKKVSISVPEFRIKARSLQGDKSQEVWKRVMIIEVG